jgi:L-amino acid N-acyltransferase YncA
MEIGLALDDLDNRSKKKRKHRLPHRLAEVDGSVAGYAYAVPFRKRPAYRYTLKHSIYVHHAFIDCGIGQTLLPAPMDDCAPAGYRQLIGYIDTANKASLRLHEAFGFVRVGLLPAVVVKFGQWVDTVMVQRALGPGDTTLPGPWPQTPSPPWIAARAPITLAVTPHCTTVCDFRVFKQP